MNHHHLHVTAGAGEFIAAALLVGVVVLILRWLIGPGPGGESQKGNDGTLATIFGWGLVAFLVYLFFRMSKAPAVKLNQAAKKPSKPRPPQVIVQHLIEHHPLLSGWQIVAIVAVLVVGALGINSIMKNGRRR